MSNVQIVSSVDDGKSVTTTAVNTDTGKSATETRSYGGWFSDTAHSGHASANSASAAVNKVS